MRIERIFIGFVASAAMALGATTACPTAQGVYTSSGQNVISTTNIKIAGDPTGSAAGTNTFTGINALTGGGVNGGCVATDISFNNLVATSGVFTANGGTTAIGGTLGSAGNPTYLYHETARDLVMFTTTRDCNASGGCGADDPTNQFVQYQTGNVTGHILFELTSQKAFSNGAVALFLTDYLRTSTGVFSYSLFGCRDTGAGLSITNAAFSSCSLGTAITPITGSFAALTVGSGTSPVQIASGAITSGSHFYFDLSFTMNGSGNAGAPANDVNIDTYFSAIGLQFVETPEPGSWALMGAGLGFLAWRARKRKAQTDL